jgi:uncharacterized alkaline shock family protein YloU
MKVVNAFAYLFAIFAFLTIGSLLAIVALHILSLEDAIAKIRELYASPWQSLQTGFVGLLFIMIGLVFSKMLVKTGRQAEAVIFQSELGPVMVSVIAIEDVVKKVLKRFHLIKDSKIKTLVDGKNVEIRLRLILWSGASVPELLAEIQDQIRSRVTKMLGNEKRLEIHCDVQRIEDHEVEIEELDQDPRHQTVSFYKETGR